MPAAPLPSNEIERISSLLHCNILDTVPEPEFDDLTRFAARLCDTPIALISLLDDHRQWFKSRVGLGVKQTPREQAFCGYTILGDEPLIIPDATSDPRTKDNPLVTDEPHIRFYAGVPLRLSNGMVPGTICVIDKKTRDFESTMMDDLQALALQAATQLELRLKIWELRQVNTKIRQTNENLFFKAIRMRT